MSYFKRFYDFITNYDYTDYANYDYADYANYDYADYANYDAYTFDVYKDCNQYKSIYIPILKLYAYYLIDVNKCTIISICKVDEQNVESFNKSNFEQYTNIKKVKVSSEFCFELDELYKIEDYFLKRFL